MKTIKAELVWINDLFMKIRLKDNEAGRQVEVTG